VLGRRSRFSLVATLAVAGAAAASVSAPASASPTPVLGTSSLTAGEITRWYAEQGVRSRSPTPVSTLARLFIREGRAQGVRGDIAFAQSMIETGFLRYGGQVQPSDHNYSGLGACDSCRRGLAFRSPTLGVRAQIQHLYAYADREASREGLARPLADARFDKVKPKGRSRTWERMGRGNWATDPRSSGKVLRTYRSMVRFAEAERGAPIEPDTEVPESAPVSPSPLPSGGGGIPVGLSGAGPVPVQLPRTR
jgi:hypothetical protein